MDIVELSKKMEGDLLDSGSRKYYGNNTFGPAPVPIFSPKQTRSRTKLGKHHQGIESNNKSSPALRANENNISETVVKKHRTNKNLETIYETPVWKKGCTLLLGNAKVKRSLYLDREFRRPSKVKSKLRKIKIKKMGKKFKLLKMSDDEFRNKMLKIENFINETDAEIQSNNSNCDNDAAMEVQNKTDDIATQEVDMQE